MTMITKEGLEFLKEIRVNCDLVEAPGVAPVRMIAQLPSEECGCPEEIWVIDGIFVLMHFEDDGSSEAFFFAGDWEREEVYECENMQQLRAAVFCAMAGLD